jgi:hypothetical protein
MVSRRRRLHRLGPDVSDGYAPTTFPMRPAPRAQQRNRSYPDLRGQRWPSLRQGCNSRDPLALAIAL